MIFVTVQKLDILYIWLKTINLGIKQIFFKAKVNPSQFDKETIDINLTIHTKFINFQITVPQFDISKKYYKKPPKCLGFNLPKF